MVHDQAGSVLSLCRYPVKSMMGEELNASESRHGGSLGDRGSALVDRSDGKVASAKESPEVASALRLSCCLCRCTAARRRAARGPHHSS